MAAAIGYENVENPQYPEQLAWSRLSYRASKWPAEARVEFRLQRVDAAAMLAQAVTSPQGKPVPSTGPSVLLIQAKISYDLPLRDADDQHVDAWFNPGTGEVLMRNHWRKGKRSYLKAYRFTDTGVYRLKRLPAGNDDAARLPADWREEEHSFYAYSKARRDCDRVTEPLILFYLLVSRNALANSLPAEVCVFGQKQLHRVHVEQLGRQRVKVDFLLTAGGAEQRRQGEREAIELVLRTLDGEAGATEPFNLLGLQQEILMLVEPESRLPLRFSGLIPGFGNVSFDLIEVRRSSSGE